MKRITRKKFIEATGREPQQDDLERCNCDLAGKIGHYWCGWNTNLDKPQFESWADSKASKGKATDRTMMAPTESTTTNLS